MFKDPSKGVISAVEEDLVNAPHKRAARESLVLAGIFHTSQRLAKD